ncbi:GNAT family N-acetyltransferase [Streptomyces sp. NPDC048243]|uniref:GNAT family N-acetyltransferase n=1 Tax=Streptomyces sp. NPDC048243 TaxID=3365522 RepID=UPI0037234B39
MPPTDASTEADTHPAAQVAPGSGPDTGTRPHTGSAPDAPTDCEDTLDLRLPDDLIALFAGGGEQAGDADARVGDAWTREAAGIEGVEAPGTGDGGAGGADLLDRVGGWGPVATDVGVFQLVPVRPDRDAPLVSRWMNDPAVAAFWELEGPQAVVEKHLRPQVDGDGRSVPCLGVLDGIPMSYWEIYRADLDPLARHYPARPHDTGIHLLIGTVADRGRGLGSALLRAVADHVLDKRPSCARVVAEPDLRNTPSVSAFLSAGFRYSAEVDLPDKRAALMVRDRALRDLL